MAQYSKTPFYRGVWGQGNIRGKSGLCLVYIMYVESYLGERNGRGISGFAVNRDAVNRGFTVSSKKCTFCNTTPRDI